MFKVVNLKLPHHLYQLIQPFFIKYSVHDGIITRQRPVIKPPPLPQELKIFKNFLPLL